jgi:hypothetical protein
MANGKMVKQDDLQQILTLRLVAATAKKNAEQAKEELDKAEAMVVAKLEEKATVQAGPLAVGVETVPGRRVPKWKECYADAMGPVAVETVINSTEPTPATLRLVIAQGGKVVKSA